CLAGQPLDDGQRHWLGRVLAEYLAHHCPTIEDAMQLRGDRGGIPWWRELANRRRDAALRELATRHFAALSITAQARQVRLLTVRYAATAWRFDRARAMPAHYADSVREWLWRAFAAGAPMPIGERQLRTILAGRATPACSNLGGT
ncbi:MAG: hypothetical protein ACREEV_01855, partial [Dongiaceae bacterium]